MLTKGKTGIFMLACAVVALATFLAGTNANAGRLNFMLANLTGQDIVDAKICPTYFPQYESENLLQGALGPQSRVYIGPDYYGEQKYWNISLKWADGREQTFQKLLLTRYNFYTVYPTAQGIRIRQTYDPKFADYEFGPDAPSYMVGESDKKVTVAGPEKVSDIRKPYGAEIATPSDAQQPAGANLSFSDSAQDSKALALKTTVKTTRDGQTSALSPNASFKPGDKVSLAFSANQNGHVYWIERNAAGECQLLFPTPENADNTVMRNKEYTVPTMDAMQLGPDAKTQTLTAILSPKAIPDLDEALKLAAAGKKAEASRLISEVLANHEKKIAENAFVIEEEDDEVVNTKMQLADGEEILVGDYEIEQQK